jgi:hypothetical protein
MTDWPVVAAKSGLAELRTVMAPAGNENLPTTGLVPEARRRNLGGLGGAMH